MTTAGFPSYVSRNTTATRTWCCSCCYCCSSEGTLSKAARMSLRAGGKGFSARILMYIPGYLYITPACWLHYRTHSNWNPRLFFVYPHLLQKLVTALKTVTEKGASWLIRTSFLVWRVNCAWFYRWSNQPTARPQCLQRMQYDRCTPRFYADCKSERKEVKHELWNCNKIQLNINIKYMYQVPSHNSS